MILVINSYGNPSLPWSLSLNNTTIPFSTSARSFGVILNQILSFHHHISHVCRTAYLKLRKISTIHHYLTTGATNTLIHAFMFLGIDYCNFLLVCIPKYFQALVLSTSPDLLPFTCSHSFFTHLLTLFF